MREQFLIWSIEHTSWWKPHSKGYTPSWSMAGRYSKEEAYSICCKANVCALNEVPVPEQFILKLEDFREILDNGIKEVVKS